MAIDWHRVRKDYEAGKAGVRELSQKHGCHPCTIRRRIRKEDWKGAAKSTGHGRGRRKAKTENSCEKIMQDHRRLWRRVKARLKNVLRNSDLKKGLEELKVAKEAGAVLANVVKGERQAWGLDELSSVENSENAGKEGLFADAGDIVSQMDSLTVPSGAGETVEGE